jgi:hypothetical protein
LFAFAILVFAGFAQNFPGDGAALRVDTAKPINEFGSCFEQRQEQAARPWSFVPNGRGGVFSNAGANGVSAPYRLQFNEARPVSEMRLFVARGTPGSDDLVEAINRCR